MIFVLAFLGLVAGGVVLAHRRSGTPPASGRIPRPDRGLDGPARVATAFGRLLPAERSEWGRAMVSELPAIDGRARRWRFAAGVAAVALVPPGHRVRAVVVAIATAAAMALFTVSVHAELRVFAGVLGGLLTVVLAASALRWHRPAAAASVTAALVVAGVASTVATVVAVTRDHPAAVSDPSHAYGIAFAVVLAAYIALAAANGRARAGAQWWGLAGAAASSLVWLALLPGHATIEGLGLWLWPVGAAGALIAAVAAAWSQRDVTAGLRAAFIAGIIGAPVFFTADLLRVLTLHRYVLTSPYDIAQYPRSGFPDVASFVLSDTLGGGIIAVLVMYPLLLAAIGLLGGAVGAAGRSPAPAAAAD